MSDLDFLIRTLGVQISFLKDAQQILVLISYPEPVLSYSNGS